MWLMDAGYVLLLIYWMCVCQKLWYTHTEQMMQMYVKLEWCNFWEGFLFPGMRVNDNGERFWRNETLLYINRRREKKKLKTEKQNPGVIPPSRWVWSLLIISGVCKGKGHSLYCSFYCFYYCTKKYQTSVLPGNDSSNRAFLVHHTSKWQDKIVG